MTAQAPEVVITKGGNEGGRRTVRKFGDEPNSIVNTIAFMPPEVRRRYHENQRRHSDDASSLERWAAHDFASGSEVI